MAAKEFGKMLPKFIVAVYKEINGEDGFVITAYLSTKKQEFTKINIMETAASTDIQTALPYFLRHKTVWSSYDSEADVLYLHFKKPNVASDSEMTEDEIIIRYQENEIIGLTILNASQRIESNL